MISHHLLLVAAVLALFQSTTVNAFAVPRATNVRSTTKTSLADAAPSAADGVDLGEMLSNAKEAFADAVDLTDAATSGSDDAADILSTLPPEAGIAVLGALVVFGGIAAATSGSSDSSTSEISTAAPKKKKAPPAPKFDVSIDYDAAARLAYNEWMQSQENVSDSDQAFAAFKARYEEMAVAQVTAKHLAREMTRFDPTKPAPKPRPTPTPTPKAAAPAKATLTASTSATPFFAEVVKS